MTTPSAAQRAPSRSPVLHSGSSTLSANLPASSRMAAAVSFEYSACGGQARSASVPNNSSSTKRRSLTGARYDMAASSVRERGHDVGRGEFDEALHARIVLEPRGKHGVQRRRRGRLPVGEHLAHLSGGDALAAQEFR